MSFQCEYNEDNYDCYTCRVVKIFKTPSASKDISFIGEHLRGRSDDDVKYFLIEHQPLDAFPKNLHEKFPNLTKLLIYGCGLKKISKTDLRGFKNLEELNLGKNDLTSLSDELFAGMEKLKGIKFDNNKLERMSSNLLKPIESLLNCANFTGNTKINDYYQKQYGHKNLKRLMQIMDSLEPPLPETDSVQNTDRQHEHHQQVIAKFAEFKTSDEFTDFTIKVRGKDFKVHKAILAAQSPVFRKAFTNGDETTEKTFTKIKNFSEESFGHFLDFFYCGRVDETVNALEVFELASVFEVAMLKGICADKIAETLSLTNALEVFNLGHHYNSDQLREKAFKVIQKMFPELSGNMIDNPKYVNRLIETKRELDAMLEATARA